MDPASKSDGGLRSDGGAEVVLWTDCFQTGLVYCPGSREEVGEDLTYWGCWSVNSIMGNNMDIIGNCLAGSCVQNHPP